MLVLNLGVSLLAVIALVQAQSQFHLTPNIVAVEQFISAGQQIIGLDNLRDAANIPDCFTLKVEQTSRASNGLKRQKLRLLYQGVPIRIARLQASIDDNNLYTGAVSGYYPTSFTANFNTNPSVSESTLKSVITDYINNEDNLPTFLPSVDESMLKNFSSEKQIDLDANGQPTLVYFAFGRIEKAAPVGGPTKGIYIRYPRAVISVSSLTPIKIELNVLKASGSNKACPKAKGGNEKFPGYTYGPGSKRVCLKAQKNGGDCSYQNNNVEVWTVDNSFDRNTAEIVSFQCSKGPDDGINGAYSPSSDAFYFSERFYSMLGQWAGIQNTKLEPIKLYVHFGDQYSNSFFDGSDLTFGDGRDDLTYPVVFPEVLGHELCHAVTDGLGNLQMGQESVALNEAFSDICGKALTVFETGENDWLFAKEFLRDELALRYFYNPTLDGLAISHLDDFDINLSVYSIMGIMTKFMHSVVAEENVPYRDAFQAAVFANKIYWNEESSIIDGACGILRAANDLALDIAAFKNAFNTVGIDLAFCSLDGTQDVIVGSTGYGYSDRQPIVSKTKNPTYVISPSAGVSKVEIHAYPIDHDSDAEIKIFKRENGNDVEYSTNSVEIALGTSDILVGLKSNSNDEELVDLSFIFLN